MTSLAPSPIRYPSQDVPGEGEAIEIGQGVLWLRLPLPMQLDHVNVYALDEGTGWTIIDTGFDTRRTRAIWQAILAGPLRGKPVQRVVLTHHHPDHVGLAGWFQTEYGAQVWATRTAWLLARMLRLDDQPLPPPETLAFWRAAGMDAALYEARRHQRPFNYADVVAPLPLGYQRLREGDLLHMAGRAWDLRIGNGHAPEHATFWSRDCGLVIAGDQILPSISPNLGVHVTEPEADPVGDWLEACTRLAGFAREDHLVLPGHKLPFTGLPARMRQLIDNHHTALERLLDYLHDPHTAAECFAPLFHRRIGEGEYGLALAEALGHLNHLHHSGEITRRRGPQGAWLWHRKDRQ